MIHLYSHHQSLNILNSSSNLYTSQRSWVPKPHLEITRAYPSKKPKKNYTTRFRKFQISAMLLSAIIDILHTCHANPLHLWYGHRPFYMIRDFHACIWNGCIIKIYHIIWLDSFSLQNIIYLVGWESDMDR